MRVGLGGSLHACRVTRYLYIHVGLVVSVQRVG